MGFANRDQSLVGSGGRRILYWLFSAKCGIIAADGYYRAYVQRLDALGGSRLLMANYAISPLRIWRNTDCKI